MDKQGLVNYVSILREIAENDRRLEEMRRRIDKMRPAAGHVADTVSRGKRGKKNLGTVRIEGADDYRMINKEKARLRRRIERKHRLLAKLNAQAASAEEYIDGLPDSELRRILTFKCIDGKRTWKEVAEAMGEGYTDEACRKIYSRFLKK